MGIADDCPDGSGPFAQSVFESVQAGFPSPAQGYYNGPVDLNRHLIVNPTSTFIVRVSGHSMAGAGIYDGDELIVDRSLDPVDGSVVVAVVDSELTVKRFHRDGGKIRLAAENPEYSDIPLTEDTDMTIWGVATRCLHRV